MLSTGTRTALWVSTLQAILVLSWTLYVLFLPNLAARAGIPAGWIVWILIADQAIFVVTDWASGVYADRLAKVVGRLGHALAGAALLSGALLALLPTAAELGDRSVFLGIVALWATVSSFLRAPAFSLLGKIGGVSRKSGVVSWSLVGVSLAGAVGPLLTTTLQQADARWSLGAASLALAAAGLMATRVERLGGGPLPVKSPVPWTPATLLAGAVFLAAYGMQLQTSFASGATGPTKSSWLFLFWAGFALGLVPAARVVRSVHALRLCACALLAGAASMLATDYAELLYLRLAAQALCGATWAVLFTGAIAVTLQKCSDKGVASPLGLLMSAAALAALVRLLMLAFDLHLRVNASGLAAAAWLVSASVLLWHPWSARAARDSAA